MRPRFVPLVERSAVRQPLKKSSRLVRAPRVFRRAFGFDTHEATIFVTRFRGKPRVVRLISASGNGGEYEAKSSTARRFYQLRLLNALFPSNSIKPVAMVKVDRKDGSHFGIVSDIVKGRSLEYKRAQEVLYTSSEYHQKKPHLQTGLGNKHVKFSQNAAEEVASEIRYATGIELNDSPHNVVSVGGRPVFFEVEAINFDRLKSFIRSMPPGPKQDAINRIFTQLRDMSWY